MPVLTQIADVTDRIFDAAETANTRASGAAVALVDNIVDGINDNVTTVTSWATEAEVPFVDRLQSIELPLVDRLPQPADAVTSTFDFIASGIAFNRSIAERVIDAFAPEAEAPVKQAPAKKAPTKKAPAKKSAAAKSAANKPATAKKTPAKKTPAKKSPAKKSA